jgi:hypothetical protein
MGDRQKDALRVDFDRHIKLEFHGSIADGSGIPKVQALAVVQGVFDSIVETLAS